MRSDTVKKGYEKAPHRALLRATGVRDEDFDKPFVAIVNSYVDVVPGHVHLQEFGSLVKEAVRAAGAVPFEFNTIGVDDGIAMGHMGMKYSLPSRELIADCVETMIEAHRFDAMVCIPNCDKIVPGILLAAMRVNVPTIFVSGGAMKAGMTPDGETLDLISVFEGVGAFSAGKIDETRLALLEKFACPSCGSCSGMFTANSMNCLMEVLGLAFVRPRAVVADQLREVLVEVEEEVEEGFEQGKVSLRRPTRGELRRVPVNSGPTALAPGHWFSSLAPIRRTGTLFLGASGPMER